MCMYLPSSTSAVLFPGIAPAFSSPSCLFFPSERSPDLCTVSGDVHVTDTTVCPTSTHPPGGGTMVKKQQV